MTSYTASAKRKPRSSGEMRAASTATKSPFRKATGSVLATAGSLEPEQHRVDRPAPQRALRDRRQRHQRRLEQWRAAERDTQLADRRLRIERRDQVAGRIGLRLDLLGRAPRDRDPEVRRHPEVDL